MKRNLIGERFHRLLVIEAADDYVSPKGHRASRWLCICDCGNEVTVNISRLTTGDTKSCGCYQKDQVSRANFIDITGHIFGKLIVLKLDHFDKKHGAYWLCECACGNQKIIRRDALKSGATGSCGKKCVLGRSKNILDIGNKRFGKLTVICIHSKDKSGSVIWECLCDCGKTKNILGKSLRSGITTSCGCLTESVLSNELKRYFSINYNAICEYKIFKNPETNYYLPYDIYLPKENVFIEVHGLQHYEKSSWHDLSSKRNNTTTPEEEFEYQKKKDRMKRKFARKNGTYIEIDLRKIKMTDNAIAHIESLLRNL